MATESRRTADVVAGRLQREPWRFAFFQAVRLLEAQSRQAGGDATRVRYRTTLSRAFPASEITRFKQVEDDEGRPVAEMEVAFLGLTGPLGVLPEHYLDLLYQQVRKRDDAMRDFFDLFNHRTITLFHRAWEKYRPLLAYERALRDREHDDPMTRLLACVSGLGTGGQADRQAFEDPVVLGFAGHFAHRPRSAWALRTVLADHFGVPVAIQQFIGRWLLLEPEQYSRLPGHEVPEGQFNRIGVDMVLGSRAWDEQGKFRLMLGPLDYEQFERLLPQSDAADADLNKLCDLTRFYVGIGLDFDIQLVLKKDQVPRLSLGRSPSGVTARLGWNSWLGHRPSHGDRGETVFDASLGC